MKNNYWLSDVLGIIGIVILAVMLLGYPLMWLWNAILPDLFGFKEITFWQAVGLNLIGTILFGRSSSSSDKK